MEMIIYQKNNDPIFSDLKSLYVDSSFALIFSMMIIYPISIATIIAAIAVSVIVLAIGVKKGNRKERISSSSKQWRLLSLLTSNITLTAGILAIIAPIGLIYSIQSFKTQFSENAELLGGIIGEEWKGKADVIVNRLIMIGFGPYLAIVSGIISIFNYLIEKTYQRQDNLDAG